MNLFKELHRMCKYHSDCNSCPLDCSMVCQGEPHVWDKEDIKVATEIITDWSKLHPANTYLNDFKKKFPNYYPGRDLEIMNHQCVKKLYGVKIDCEVDKKRCVDCWNTEMSQ